MESEQLGLQPGSLLPENLPSESYTPEELIEFDPEVRLTFPRFFTEISRNFPETYSDDDAYDAAKPASIESGLLIPRYDPRRRQNPTNLIVTDGGFDTKPRGHMFAPSVGVVFDSEIFKIVARSPGDLAKASKAETLKKITKERIQEDSRSLSTEEMAKRKEEDEQRTIRSAVHALDSKIVAMDSLRKVLDEDRHFLLRMRRAIKPNSRIHFKAKNLSRYRKELDERIHDTTDLASKNMDWSPFLLVSIHRAIYNNIYNQPHQRRISNIRGYIEMLGRHCRAKQEKTILSRHATVAVRDEHMELLPERMQAVIREEYSAAYS